MHQDQDVAEPGADVLQEDLVPAQRQARRRPRRQWGMFNKLEVKRNL